jgi:phytoene synthase
MATQYASRDDYAVCRSLHRRFGTTYYFASRRFPRVIRDRVDAVYGFVRVADEWVDNPGSLTKTEQAELLGDWRRQLWQGVAGVCPTDAVMRAFCDVVVSTKMPLEEPMLFLDAMEMDLNVNRYETYADLQGYMRGSAAAVGVMMCHVLGADMRGELLEQAKALGDAMQLTNFLRDIAEDRERGRVYVPQEDLRCFNVCLDELHEATDPFIKLMQFEIKRARNLYSFADQGIANLPRSAQPAVKLARILYSRILDRIEEQGYDVFSCRARTSTPEKLGVAVRVAMGWL